MNYYIYGFTDKGNYRSNNEDSMLIYREVIQSGGCEATVSAPFLTAICDGVGGEQAGEIASRLCLQHLSILDYSSKTNLDETLLNIHNKIKKCGISDAGAVNMQTTLCCLAVDENGSATCINVGDSRMYRYVNGSARQISCDQTYGRFLYENGEINDLDELDPKMQSAIISSMGSVLQQPLIDYTQFVSEFGGESDDTVFICSDGISDYVSLDEIEIAMSLDLPFKDKVEALCELSLKNGSTDNISLIGIKPYHNEQDLEKLLNITAPEEITIAVEEQQLAIDSIAELEQMISDIE